MKIIIGSQALWNHIHAPRVIIDTDIVCDYDEIEYLRGHIKPVTIYPINGGKSMFMRDTLGDITECEIAWPDSRAEKFLEFARTFPDAFSYDFDTDTYKPSLNVLYMLKMSHRYLKDSPHFLKTMEDIKLMRDAGAFIQDEWSPFYEQRMKDTYTYSLPKLNQSKADFFDNTTNIYTLDHDSIHESVKHLCCPAYEFIKSRQTEVMCDKDMFTSSPEHVKLLCVLEESYVLSIERSIHPYPDVDRKWAFDMALMKLCTSISSGWFREFAWENYDEVQRMYNSEYVGRFYGKLYAGVIKPFEKEVEYGR